MGSSESGENPRNLPRPSLKQRLSKNKSLFYPRPREPFRTLFVKNGSFLTYFGQHPKSMPKINPFEICPRDLRKIKNSTPVGNLGHCRLTTKKSQKKPILKFSPDTVNSEILSGLRPTTDKNVKNRPFFSTTRKKALKSAKKSTSCTRRKLAGAGPCVLHNVCYAPCLMK